MEMLRKGLGGVALLLALAALFNYYFFIVAEYAGQIIWNIIDPILIVALAMATLLNVADSLRVRGAGGNQPGQLPRDVVTALAAATAMFYLHNYLVKVTQGVAAANPWIWHFIVPPAVILLAIEGISLWWGARRETDAS